MGDELIKRQASKSENIELDDLDDLLAQLTQEEIDELNGDFDPDVSCTQFSINPFYTGYWLIRIFIKTQTG